jgi:hypothetical protein
MTGNGRDFDPIHNFAYGILKFLTSVGDLMRKTCIIAALLFFAPACGNNNGKEPLTTEVSGSMNTGAQKFVISSAIPSFDACPIFRLATYDEQSKGTYRSGCIDANRNFISLSANDVINLSDEDDVALKSSLSAVDLNALLPYYLSPSSGADGTDVNVDLVKDDFHFITNVALQGAVNLPSDLALFLTIAAKDGFIPGGIFVASEEQ